MLVMASGFSVISWKVFISLRNTMLEEANLFVDVMTAWVNLEHPETFLFAHQDVCRTIVLLFFVIEESPPLEFFEHVISVLEFCV